MSVRSFSPRTYRLGIAAVLDVLETHRVLRVARPGRLRAWLGPALRGLAGGRLRARACRQPVADQLGAWRHCAGCPLAAGCAYGETLEGGAGDATRPIVVAPAYPCPEVGRVGDQIPVRVVFVGPVAAAHAAAFWDALRVGGADPLLGLGDDCVLFDVLPGTEPDQTARVELPADPAAVPGVLSAVRVELTGPLVLRVRGGPGGEKQLIDRPTLANLLWRWETLEGLFAGCGAPLPAGAVGRVKDLAERVPTRRAEFRPVGQERASSRSGRWEVWGVFGRAEYGPVPAGLLPWLAWAGRLHVGTDRVAGAGGWKTAAGRYE